MQRRYELLNRIDDMPDDITFIQRMADYAAESDFIVTNSVIAGIAERGMIGFPFTKSFQGKTVRSCNISIGDRSMIYIGNEGDDVQTLLEKCLNSMAQGPMWRHCGECTYIGTYPRRDGQGWGDLWLACGFSAAHYFVRTGDNDGCDTNDPASLIYCAAIEK